VKLAVGEVFLKTGIMWAL